MSSNQYYLSETIDNYEIAEKDYGIVMRGTEKLCRTYSNIEKRAKNGSIIDKFNLARIKLAQKQPINLSINYIKIGNRETAIGCMIDALRCAYDKKDRKTAGWMLAQLSRENKRFLYNESLERYIKTINTLEEKNNLIIWFNKAKEQDKYRYDKSISLLICGTKSGKKALADRFTGDVFSKEFIITKGTIKIATRDIGDMKLKYKLDVFRDKISPPTAGEIILDKKPIIITYDCTNKQSFIEAKKWCEHNIELGYNKNTIFLVETKNDLENSRVVDKEVGHELVKELGIGGFYSTSAKTGMNVELCFSNIAKKVLGLQCGIPENQNITSSSRHNSSSSRSNSSSSSSNSSSSSSNSSSSSSNSSSSRNNSFLTDCKNFFSDLCNNGSNFFNSSQQVASKVSYSDQRFNIQLLGEANSGKTSLIRRYVKGIYSEDFQSTAGPDVTSKTHEYEGGNVELIIWNSMNKREMKISAKAHPRNVVIVTYDPSNKDSFEKIKKMVEDCRGNITDEEQKFVPIYYLVETKNNITDKERQVTHQEAEELAKNENMTFFSISAETGNNVNKLFDNIVENVIEKTQSQQFKI